MSRTRSGSRPCRSAVVALLLVLAAMAAPAWPMVGRGRVAHHRQPGLRIYTTTAPTGLRLPTLMHDPQYRVAVAWQNVAYKPPHPSF